MLWMSHTNTIAFHSIKCIAENIALVPACGIGRTESRWLNLRGRPSGPFNKSSADGAVGRGYMAQCWNTSFLIVGYRARFQCRWYLFGWANSANIKRFKMKTKDVRQTALNRPCQKTIKIKTRKGVKFRSRFKSLCSSVAMGSIRSEEKWNKDV